MFRLRDYVLSASLLLGGCTIYSDHGGQKRQDIKDDDRDGVVNVRDKCLDTPPNAVVDNEGCPNYLEDPNHEHVVVFFEVNSKAINSIGQSHILELSNYLKSNKDVYAIIEGHTSDIGDVNHNIVLSGQRAAVIKDRLIELGVEGTRLVIVKQGEKTQRVKDSKIAEHSVNQRVYIKTYYINRKVEKKWNMIK